MDNKTYTDQPELPLKISNEISLKTTPMFQQYLLISLNMRIVYFFLGWEIFMSCFLMML